ncbi:MAG: protein-signal peptide and transmembrane prediction [Planctomycetaceae bacterium]|jgi:nicotinamidase-related amidase|nr:protein-signal peptide and transmembrane prediction [Planctomycetaceae bacterium]
MKENLTANRLTVLSRQFADWITGFFVCAIFVTQILIAGINQEISADEFKVHVQKRVAKANTNNTDPKSVEYKIEIKEETWKGKETAIVICDMWDKHWCKGATSRVAEMAPRMNEVLKAARAKNVTIIHAPSGCISKYNNTEPRKRIEGKRDDEFEKKYRSNKWFNGKLQTEKDAVWPIDQSDGGCDCEPQCKQGRAWKSQIDILEIDNNKDVISDNGTEIITYMHEKGIKNVILLGVHTNMCVIGRPFGLRKMVTYEQNVVLMRDMTDTMYNSRKSPFVSHFKGTGLVIEYIEKYVAPSITSTDFLGGKPFAFKGSE